MNGEAGGILTRLRHDRRGNTIAIAAASLIPLMGFSGSAIDMGRLYLVKVRLQQACDAGVLAGRKVMTDTTTTGPLDAEAKKQASAFFSNNFRAGYMRTTAVDFQPVKATSGTDSTVANAVTATATASVPMAVMGYFGVKAVKMDVSCQAVFDMADTDVMFVLDTTGSMSCTPSASSNCANAVTSEKRSNGSTRYYNQESGNSKIEALRKAVLLFDSTMRSSADASTHFRYGFVTYSSGVNVGMTIPSGYLQTGQWTYDTRRLATTVPANIPGAIAGDYAFGAASSVSLPNVPKAMCVAQRSPATGFAKTGYTWNDEGYFQARAYYNLSWSGGNVNSGTCSGTQQPLRPYWLYGPASLLIDNWIASANPNNPAAVNPSRLDGSTGRWRGCIEEVDTQTPTTFDPKNLPDDLDPDTKPTGNNRWRPQWPDATWGRNDANTALRKDEDVNESSPNDYYDTNYGPDGYWDRNGSAACGMPAERLKVWTADEVKNYVYNPEFRPYGGTYHDVGMIWGARMLSPDGVYGTDTAPWPGRKQPSRNIVFMTDGTMAPSQTSYGLYGIERLDNRTGGANDSNKDYDNHTARFLAVCEAGKRKGYTIYVVALGTAITDDLRTCASPGQTFQASSTDALTAAFKTIAQRVAMLRISQ